MWHALLEKFTDARSKMKEQDDSRRAPDGSVSFPRVIACWGFGSRYTVDPPPMDTDDDVIALVAEQPKPSTMAKLGWKVDGEPDKYDNTKLVSYRNGTKNIVLTTSKNYYVRMCAASELCKAMNLPHKEDRIAIHQAIADGHFFVIGSSIDPPLPDRGFL